MLIKHLNKKDIGLLMKVGKNVSTPSFLFKFFIEKPIEPPKNSKSPENPYLPTFFISALSPKSHFKTAVLRNKVRRKIYGAINLMNYSPKSLILRAIILPNKTLLTATTIDLQNQILSIFSKIGV